MRLSRDRHRAAVMVADAGSGEARMLFVDSLNTYIETRPLEMLANGDMLWWSERDGWAHLYLYGPDGQVKQRLTEGAWHVDGIVGVDEARGFVFFTGQGREEGEDPYYAHLYRVGLNGTGLTLLNPGDYDHQSEMSESSRFFVSNYSRVNIVPASALFDAAGRRILDLGEADFSALEAAGYGFPEPYRVEAADGVTDIYGVMYRPYDFDPSKTYPIVAYVYPGSADRIGLEVVVGQPVRTGSGAIRHDRGDHGEPGRPSRPLQVVPQLWIWKSARLWTGRQKGRHRATRRPP